MIRERKILSSRSEHLISLSYANSNRQKSPGGAARARDLCTDDDGDCIRFEDRHEQMDNVQILQSLWRTPMKVLHSSWVCLYTIPHHRSKVHTLQHTHARTWCRCHYVTKGVGWVGGVVRERESESADVSVIRVQLAGWSRISTHMCCMYSSFSSKRSIL